MPFALLACFVEENYLHTVRRTINNFKKNIQDIKPNTLIKIKTLLENNKKLMVKTMLDDIKSELNSVKFSLPKNYGNYWIKVEITDYYLRDILLGNRTLYEWEYEYPWTWSRIKKDLMEDFKDKLNNASIGYLYSCFEESLNKYGKLEKHFKYSEPSIFMVRTEVYNTYEGVPSNKIESLINPYSTWGC